MKHKHSLLILVFLIVLVSPSIVSATSTVGTSTYFSASETTFYADGFYWSFYYNGSSIVYASSSDGDSWSSPTFCTNGSLYFDACTNGSHVHYVLGYSGKFYYRLGSFSTGVINWITTEQVVASYWTDKVSLCVDSSEYPFIAYGNASDNKLYVIKSEWNNGSWSTESGFPVNLNSTANYWDGVFVSPLSSGRVYVVYARHGETVRGRLYNGSALETEQVISSSTVGSGEAISATVENDTIHLVFKSYDGSTHKLQYVQRDNATGGWTSEILLQSNVGEYSFPVIVCDSSKLFVFWIDGSVVAPFGYPIIYFKSKLHGEWMERQIFLSVSSGVNRGSLTSFHEKTSHKLGLLYTSGTSSPYNLQFDYFTYTASATPFTINNTGFDCPIFDASYDVESGILSFRTSGNVTISGAIDNCLWIVDDDDYLSSWSWNAGTGEISLINVDGVIRLYWSIGAGSTTGGSTQRDTEPVIFKPVKIGSTGLYLIIGAVGVLTVAGIIKKGRTGKVRKRLNGNRSSNGIRRPHGARRK